MKKSLRLLSEERLTPREVKPCGFVDHFLLFSGKKAKKWSGWIFLTGNRLYPQKFADYRKMLTTSHRSEIVSKRPSEKTENNFEASVRSGFSGQTENGAFSARERRPDMETASLFKYDRASPPGPSEVDVL